MDKTSHGNFVMPASISRRAILLATTSLTMFKWLPARGADAPPGSTSNTRFNGGRTQLNVTSVQGGGDYTFINLIKMAQGWGYNHPPSDPHAPPSPIIELDENGYITRVVPGTGGVYTVFQMPTKTQYDGEWLLRWEGNGTLELGAFGTAKTGGSLISVRGSGSYRFRRTDDGGSPGLRVLETANYPNHVCDIRLCKVKNKDLLDAGKDFDPDSLARIKMLNPGVIRSLGWGGLFNGTNESQATTWATRMPKSYFSYGSTYNSRAFYGGITTNKGSDYTLNYSNFALINKAGVTLTFNANAPQTGRTSIRYSASKSQPISILWPSHGLAIDNAVAFGNNHDQPPGVVEAQFYYIVGAEFDRDSFQISETSGGSPVVGTSTKSGSCIAISIPRININDTGFVPVTSYETPMPGNVFIGFNFTQYPKAGILSHLVFDATIGYFYMNQGGYIAGVPPETFIDYCAEVGAHPHLVTPYLSIEPVSDFMARWSIYATSTYSWMRPRIEPPNECWNGDPAFRSTFYAQSLAYRLWGAINDPDNAYGKWCSTLGQEMSALYGGDRAKYLMICSIQTTSAYNDGINDARLKSTLFVSRNGGQPAYKFVDRVCAANYFSPSERFTCQELVDAYEFCEPRKEDRVAQEELAKKYVATCQGSNAPYTVEFVVQCFKNLKRWAQSMPLGSTITGITCYEGGYSPDYLSGDWSTSVKAASRAMPCVLTMASISQNPEASNLSGNPAVVGMQLNISGETGMVELNCSEGECRVTPGSSKILWAPPMPLVVGQLVTFYDRYTGSKFNYGGEGGLPAFFASNVPTPLIPGKPYYVVDATPTAFQISAQKGGTAISISDANKIAGARVQSGWRITAVSGNAVTIDVDSSGFRHFVGGSLATYSNSQFYSNSLRQAGGQSGGGSAASGLGAQNKAMNDALSALSVSGFVFEFPSNFLWTGSGNVWSILNPDIYEPPTSQWNSVAAYNNK